MTLFCDTVLIYLGVNAVQPIIGHTAVICDQYFMPIFVALLGLWQSASDTAHDLLGRLAIVHMVHEAR